MSRKLLWFLWFFAAVAITGCGSSSGTSGSLSLSQPASSAGLVSVSATYTPTTGKTLIAGQEVTFTWWTVGVTSKTQTATITASGYINDSGIAVSQLTLPTNRTESVNVFVNAKIGGISSSTMSLLVGL